MSTASACHLLASLAPISTEWQAGLISVLAGLALILSILAHFRRRPPLDSELTKIHSAVETLRKAVETLDETAKSHAAHGTEIGALQDKVRRLETQREIDLANQRKYTRETTHEIFEKLDALKSSVSSNFQEMERSLGKIEGKLESLSAT